MSLLLRNGSEGTSPDPIPPQSPVLLTQLKNPHYTTLFHSASVTYPVWTTKRGDHSSSHDTVEYPRTPPPSHLWLHSRSEKKKLSPFWHEAVFQHLYRISCKKNIKANLVWGDRTSTRNILSIERSLPSWKSLWNKFVPTVLHLLPGRNTSDFFFFLSKEMSSSCRVMSSVIIFLSALTGRALLSCFEDELNITAW